MGISKHGAAVRLAGLALGGAVISFSVPSYAQSSCPTYPDSNLDFGDAPQPMPVLESIVSNPGIWFEYNYPTLKSSCGAAHVTGPLRLGLETTDYESDGQPSEDALGDDQGSVVITAVSAKVSADAPPEIDDEDGISLQDPEFFGGYPFFIPGYGPTAVAGLPFWFYAYVSGAPNKTNAKLSAFFDFYRQGNWLSPAASVIGKSVKNGNNFVQLPVPIDAVPGPSFARFRLSSKLVSLPTGAADDGEVEDYRFTILSPSSLHPKVTTFRPIDPLLIVSADLRVLGGNTPFLLGSAKSGVTSNISSEGCSGDSDSDSHDSECVEFFYRETGEFLCRGERQYDETQKLLAAVIPSAIPQTADLGLYACGVEVGSGDDEGGGNECRGRRCSDSSGQSPQVTSLLKYGFNVKYYGNPLLYYAPSNARGYVRALR